MKIDDIKPGPSFKPWGIRAILSGQKTQTRRVIKPQPAGQFTVTEVKGRGTAIEERLPNGLSEVTQYAPYQPGQTYYVREGLLAGDGRRSLVMFYEADGEPVVTPAGNIVPWQKDTGEPYKVDKLPAIYMPRRAARLFITITDVRPERLHEITPADARAEGTATWDRENNASIPEYGDGNTHVLLRSFHELWDSIHDTHTWGENPWVWVFTFKAQKIEEILDE